MTAPCAVTRQPSASLSRVTLEPSTLSLELGPGVVFVVHHMLIIQALRTHADDHGA